MKWHLKEDVGPNSRAEVDIQISVHPLRSDRRVVHLRVREPHAKSSIFLEDADVASLIEALELARTHTAQHPVTPTRPAAIDLAIPEQLAGTFSFIGGRADGVLFAMLPRPAVMQLTWEGGVERQHLMAIPLAIPANALITLDLKDPR